MNESMGMKQLFQKHIFYLVCIELHTHTYIKSNASVKDTRFQLRACVIHSQIFYHFSINNIFYCRVKNVSLCQSHSRKNPSISNKININFILFVNELKNIRMDRVISKRIQELFTLRSSMPKYLFWSGQRTKISTTLINSCRSATMANTLDKRERQRIHQHQQHYFSFSFLKSPSQLVFVRFMCVCVFVCILNRIISLAHKIG